MGGLLKEKEKAEEEVKMLEDVDNVQEQIDEVEGKVAWVVVKEAEKELSNLNETIPSEEDVLNSKNVSLNKIEDVTTKEAFKKKLQIDIRQLKHTIEENEAEVQEIEDEIEQRRRMLNGTKKSMKAAEISKQRSIKHIQKVKDTMKQKKEQAMNAKGNAMNEREANLKHAIEQVDLSYAKKEECSQTLATAQQNKINQLGGDE